MSGGVRKAGGGSGRSRLSLPQQRVSAGGKGEAALAYTFVGVGVVLCVWFFFLRGVGWVRRESVVSMEMKLKVQEI